MDKLKWTPKHNMFGWGRVEESRWMVYGGWGMGGGEGGCRK